MNQDAFKYEHPSLISFEITNKCNFKCLYCYDSRINRPSSKISSENDVSSQKEMTVDEIRKYLIPQIDEMKFRYFVWIGGEPTLRFNDIIDLAPDISGIKSLEETCVSTNGYLLTEDMLDRYKRAYSRFRWNTIAISLDSLNPETQKKLRPPKEDVFDRVMNAIDMSLKKGFFVSIQTVTNRLNFQELIPMINFVKKKGMRCVMELYPMIRTGYAKENDDLSLTKEQWKELDRIRVKYYGNPILASDDMPCPFDPEQWFKIRDKSTALFQGCSAGNNFFNVDHAGNVYPCNYLPIKLGNIKNDAHELRNLWNTHEIVQKLRNREVKGKCGTCKHRYVCGGCRSRAYAETGDLFAGIEDCEGTPEGHPLEKEATKNMLRAYRYYKSGLIAYNIMKKLHLV
jgi:radical SAM protein with 4Fe4S-binding SPASM domain